MNVFDDEMGPLASQEELNRLAFLIAAGLTLEEIRAWYRLVTSERVN